MALQRRAQRPAWQRREGAPCSAEGGDLAPLMARGRSVDWSLGSAGGPGQLKGAAGQERARWGETKPLSRKEI